MDRSRIGIVIPALNESLTIENIVKTVVKYGLPIVVDDGSVDDTSKLAVSAGAVVVSHLQNCGYDCALNSGFKKADELGIEILPLHGPYFCQKCGVVTSAKTCRHEEDAPEVITHISGTDMRDILMGGREPDPHIMRAEVIAALRDVDIFIEETES